ncbi:uncharacterized protein VICG_01644 [Vittaforma corneae ATCC 50505]|uniref:Myosin motor domain-containing protein n=1 Tax=Vittaforma corneae (strain ATCC 50505) TaxID=993615 RepID=L2GK99_VITCO|nr:uncharacterized protein VICG_01644 [Vittaforma corneae ATCC 50505]ELA41271.1 hypothetical protein VICG_01644 [Vittaforma corneae ATCC 50505]
MDSDDLCKLKNLDESSLLENLRKRYLNSQIYTNSGLFLISINPYKQIDLYTEEVAGLYKKKAAGKGLQPHVYEVLEQCLRDKDVYGEHTIIINGDSGAGKTACARYMLEYLGVPALRDADNILESLGNCKTHLNDNSSRFGKLIRLDKTVKIETYLLERSRVTGYPPNERNFHVFYYILANRKEALVNDYINFNCSGINREQLQSQTLDSAFFSTESLANSYKNLSDSFSRLSIDFQEIEIILMGIIYLGSVEIQNQSILKNKMYYSVIELLCLDEKRFDEFLLTKKFKVRISDKSEVILKKLSDSESYTMRNSLARLLYENLFYYVLDKINAKLNGISLGISQLNILDIFGFEKFEKNGLDQFCINWCNECIHDHFVKDTFEYQKSILISEGVDSSSVDRLLSKRYEQSGYANGTTDSFSSNSINHIKICGNESLDNIQKKTGVADLIIEESLINGSASNLALKLQNYMKMRIKPGNALVFKHFNGCVEYSLDDFVEKNREKCSFGFEFLSLFENQSRSSGFFDFLSKSLVTCENVVGTFRSSLNHLFGVIRNTRVKYIKCIKPNSGKTPLMFDGELVAKQLRSGGVLESIELSKHLFPYVLDFPTFAVRYPFTTLNDPCLTKGKSKVFLNNEGFIDLENRRHIYIESFNERIRELSSVFVTKKIMSEIIQSKKPMKVADKFNTSSTAEKVLVKSMDGTMNLLDKDENKCSSYVNMMRKNEDQYMKLLSRLEKDVIKDVNSANIISNPDQQFLQHSGPLETLKDENKTLKKIISDLENELKIIKHMKLSVKNINSQALNVECEAKQDRSVSNELEMLQKKFQDLAFISCYPNDTSPFGVFRSLVDLFIENFPVYSEQQYSRDDILCFAQCVYYMVCSSFQHNTKYSFDVFIEELNKQASVFQESLAGVLYVLSNLIELRCLFKERQDTLKSVFKDGAETLKKLAAHPSSPEFLNTDRTGSTSRQEIPIDRILDDMTALDNNEVLSIRMHDGMQKISHDFSTEIDFIRYILSELDISIRNLMEHFGVLLTESLSDILPHVILDYEPLKELNSKIKAARKWLFPRPTISRMIQYLEYFYGISHYYYLPASFVLSAISFSLSVVDQITFNSILTRKGFLNFNKCYEIKYNLAEIEKFCFNIGFRDGFLNLLHVNETMKIASAISRLELFQESDCKTESESNHSEYHLAYNSAQEIIDNSFLNCNQINCIISKFEESLFECKDYDPYSCKFISSPKISCPDLDQCSSGSKFVEPSYLPQKSLSRILHYFHEL